MPVINAGDSKLPEPSIRDRNTKSPAEVIDKLKGMSFAEEIKNDQVKAAVYINRPAEAAKKLPAGDPVAKQEAAAAEVYKRALLLIGAGGLSVVGNDSREKIAADNNLPIPSYLSHGGRVMIEMPKGASGENLINWLTSGNKSVNGRSSSQSQLGAIKEGLIVYSRSAATHDVNFIKQKNEKGEKEYVLEEAKGFMIGANDFVKNKAFGIKTKHFGVDLAVNAEFGGIDSEGKIVVKPDGDHGHLYIHYTPSNGSKPATLLIGLEGAAPTSSKHSKTGAPDPRSAIDSSKFGELRTKKDKAIEDEYKNTVIPRNFGGMRMKLDIAGVTAITAMKSEEYGIELAYIKPSKNAREFVDNQREFIKTHKDFLAKHNKVVPKPLGRLPTLPEIISKTDQIIIQSNTSKNEPLRATNIKIGSSRSAMLPIPNILPEIAVPLKNIRDNYEHKKAANIKIGSHRLPPKKNTKSRS